MWEDHLTAYELVLAERARQDEKWGLQNHEPAKWCNILTEEVGEVAKATLEDNEAEYLLEMTQVAAVAIAAIESLLRRKEAENEYRATQ